MFGWEFPPHYSGGLGVACHGLAKALSQENDVELTFVLPRQMDTNADFMKMIFADIPRVNVRTVNSTLYPYVTSDAYKKLHLKNKSSLYGPGLFEEVARYALCAQKIAQKESFDIIHAHDWLAYPAGIEARAVSGKPLVVHVHATEFDRTGGESINQHVYEIEKEGMEEADHVVTVSDFTKQHVIHRYGIPSHKVTVIHNGINSEEYDYELPPLQERVTELKRAGNKIVLFVGRITLQKGPDYFVRVARRVLAYKPNTYFIIAGSGDMERQIIEQAAYLGIGDRVLFAGFMRGNELNALYREADLFVLPSVSEPFGLVPLEALANKTPALISKQSGVSEIMTNILKTDFWDIDEMTNKIVAVLTHDSLRTTLAENGKKETYRLNWAHAAKKCVDLYNKLLRLKIA